MILLVDFDSILYTSVYRIVSISEIREALTKFGKEGARQWMNEEVYNEGINRCENELLKMQNHIDEMMINDISGIELFITTCKKSFRKEISETYKAKRKRNKYVWMLRDHYQINGAFHSDTLEADDLIATRAREIGEDGCLVVSMDKDLKQIGGYYWSYYKIKSKDSQGNLIMNDFGFHEREYKQKHIDFFTKEEAERFFWKQMLTGDSGDGVKGVYRIGPKKAETILEGVKNNFIAVARTYIEKEQKQDFWINYDLLKLGNPRTNISSLKELK